MTPAQLIAKAKKNAAPAAVLLLGPEAYERRRIKEALSSQFPPETSWHSLTLRTRSA